MSNTLLPPNATAQELALEGAAARSVPTPIRDIWDPDTCPAHLLPWLAWSFGVDEWDPIWSDEAKRNVIRNAVSVQRRKGSVWSIKRVIADAGYGDSELIEGDGTGFYDGERVHDGVLLHGASGQWALYRFRLQRPITNAQAEQVRSILLQTAPARCHLLDLMYTEAANIHDGTISYNGNYNHGSA